MSRVDAAVIAGPTASGKSALALALAAAVGGIVVNADSMQVYADLRILTARPSAADEHAVPHRLYGHVDGATNYSVGHYLTEMAAILARCWAGGVIPVIVGGTGLYLRALIEGLSDLPPVSPEVRATVRAAAEGRASSDLHAELAGRDPEGAASLRPSDRLRILRALEFHAATGRSLSTSHAVRQPGLLAGRRVAKVFLAPNRDALRRCIDARFTAMMAAGALDEAAALARRRLDPALPVMRAHGVPGLLAHLAGSSSLADAVARGQADTRRYVKRQFTWTRHQLTDFAWAVPRRAAQGRDMSEDGFGWPVLDDLVEAWRSRPA